VLGQQLDAVHRDQAVDELVLDGWKLPTARPNWRRSLTYSTTRSKALVFSDAARRQADSGCSRGDRHQVGQFAGENGTTSAVASTNSTSNSPTAPSARDRIDAPPPGRLAQ